MQHRDKQNCYYYVNVSVYENNLIIVINDRQKLLIESVSFNTMLSCYMFAIYEHHQAFVTLQRVSTFFAILHVAMDLLLRVLSCHVKVFIYKYKVYIH
jgi:hypothetical protein